MKTSIESRFHLRGPVILAPMAGGPTTPELAAAACEAGILGSLAAPYLKPADIEKDTRKMREFTQRPFAINLFAPAPAPKISSEQWAEAGAATEKYRRELGLPTPVLTPPYSENFEAQFEMVLKLKPAAFSFTFGRLKPEFLRECRREGVFILGTATTVEEAQALQDDGVDAVVAQGVEAGGHRGIFDPLQDDPGIGVFELVRQCSRALAIPVVAAGGLMTGKDIAKALAAGAQAAQLGTAFLLCEEAGTSKPYREALGSGLQTRLTRAFSGRLARGLENRFMLEMETQPEAILPFPAQNAFTRDLRKASADQGRSDFLSLWAGEGVAGLRPMKARDLAEALLRELEQFRS